MGQFPPLYGGDEIKTPAWWVKSQVNLRLGCSPLYYLKLVYKHSQGGLLNIYLINIDCAPAGFLAFSHTWVIQLGRAVTVPALMLHSIGEQRSR